MPQSKALQKTALDHQPPGSETSCIAGGNHRSPEPSMKKVLATFAAFSLMAVASGALAAPCKDAKGHFVKCPPAVPARPAPVLPPARPMVRPTPTAIHASSSPAASGQRCRDTKGHFVRCPPAAAARSAPPRTAPRCRNAMGQFTRC